MVSPRGSSFASSDEQRPSVLGDPAGEALAELAAQQLHVDLLVRPDRALERDRQDVVRLLDEIDPGIVVIDDPARLLDDGPADLVDRSRRGSGGPRRPGGPPSCAALASVWANSSALVRAIAACVASVVMKATSPSVQSRGSCVTAASAPMTRSWWMSGAMRLPANSRTPVVSLVAVAGVVADIRPRQDAAGPQDLADPALVAVEDGSRLRDVVGQAGPGGDLEPVVVQDADRGDIGAQAPASSRRRSSGTAPRGRATRQAFGDPEDGVETLGELGLERPAGWRDGAARGSLDATVAAARASVADDPTRRRNTDGPAFATRSRELAGSRDARPVGQRIPSGYARSPPDARTRESGPPPPSVPWRRSVVPPEPASVPVGLLGPAHRRRPPRRRPRRSRRVARRPPTPSKPSATQVDVA